MKKLAYEDLIFKINERFPKFKTTDELNECDGIIGQDRAISAISLGLEMKQKGYNIFVTGMTGTGRSTTIKKLLEKMVIKKKAKLEDKVFVHNFDFPEQPLYIPMKAGEGRKLKKLMINMIRYFLRVLPALLEDMRFKNERNLIIEKYDTKKREAIKKFRKFAKENGFSLVELDEDNRIKTVIMPLINEKPVEFSFIEEMVEKNDFDKAEFDKLKMVYNRLVLDLEKVMEDLAQLDETMEEKIERAIFKTIEPKVKKYLHNLGSMFNNKEIRDYFKKVGEYIVENPHYFFKDIKEEQDSERLNKHISDMPERFMVFDVNVIVDNSNKESPPVIIENTPTVRNLFGTIEKSIDKKGMDYSNFCNIRSGSLIDADGGYLVIDAEDMMNEANAYLLLKRALKTGQHTIQPMEQYFYHNSSSSLKPGPVPLNIKVILIGSDCLYEHLNYNEEDFSKIFKIKAQFDSEIENSLENQMAYGRFVKMLCKKEKLRPLTFHAFEQVLRFSSKFTGNRHKLSALFNNVADLLREADHFAQCQRSALVCEEHIKQAVKSREYMFNQLQEKMLDFIDLDIILINTRDNAVGQVNALVVQNSGDHVFGVPARITVSTSMGEQGIVNIEREAELSGSFFDKAVLIIDGYLRKIFAQDKPLSVNVSLAFEQSYGEVEGDSASQAEIIAILSSLSELPLKQYIGITGSVNQLGEIQTIGGVNEKIEGFFNVCKMRGLQKGQGVIIPARNINDLNLNDDVLDAVKEGSYDIWVVDRVEESVEIMMGIPAGKMDNNGSFASESVYDISNKKLWQYANTWKKWSNMD